MQNIPPETQANTESGTPISIDVRPEWTKVSLGRDFSTTACIIAGRILITRTIGFATNEDAGRYCEFIEKIKTEGLTLGQTYIHVIEWTRFKGGSVGARRLVWNFIQSQSQLQALIICGASSLMQMSIKLTQRVSPIANDILFCPDLDKGIREAGNQLSLSVPAYFELPSVVPEPLHKSRLLSNQIALLCDPPLTDGQASYRFDFSNGNGIEFRRIGNSILFCRFTGHLQTKSLETTAFLNARSQALSKCLPGQSDHIEIWDCTNFHSLFSRIAMIRLFKALFGDTLPLSGCFLLDVGYRIRSLARLSTWLNRPAYPVQCLSLLSEAMLQAQELLHTGGSMSPSPPPEIISKPQWRYGDENLKIQNEVIDQDIIHSHGSGKLQLEDIKQILSIQRQMGMEVLSSGSYYYLMVGAEDLGGGSFKARQSFLWAVRRLYRDLPFRMYIIYGARGKLKTAVKLAGYKLPFQITAAEDFESALSVIRIDKARHAYLENTESKQNLFSVQPVASQSLQRSVDDILLYLSNLSWEPDTKTFQKPLVPAGHPFAQIYDAIDLVNDDLKTIYSERQKAAEEKQKLREQLARSQKMEALGLLAGGVAHDLNNILSGIVSYPEVLLMDLPEKSLFHDALKTIRDSGKKSAAIVQDLLIMARRGVRAAEVLNLNELVRDYLQSAEHRTIIKRYPDISVKADLTEDLNNTCGSPTQVKQTIMNLVINAIEASNHSGTGIVTVRTENRVLDKPINGYDSIAAGSYVTLQVDDNGVGISREDQEHIFEPFYTKKKMGRSGTGLGMAVVWGTVHDCDGYIDLRSHVGHGTVFTLYFPMSNKAKPVRLHRKTQEIKSGNGETILVVDDVQQQCEIAKAALERLSYRVDTVNSGEAALGLLEHKSMDLVIVDTIMDTGMDGLETIQRIKHRNPKQRVVICTGGAPNASLMQAQALCTGPIINKPYSISTISRSVHKALKSGKLE